jgi:hypothetical protein
MSSFIAAGGYCTRRADKHDNNRCADNDDRCSSNRNDHDRCSSNRNDHNGCCSEHTHNRFNTFHHYAVGDSRNSGRNRDNTGHGDGHDSNPKTGNGGHWQLRYEWLYNGQQHCNHNQQHDGAEGINLCYRRNNGSDLAL